MKTHAMAGGLRVTVNMTELQTLLALARYGAEQIMGIRPRLDQADMTHMARRCPIELAPIPLGHYI